VVRDPYGTLVSNALAVAGWQIEELRFEFEDDQVDAVRGILYGLERFGRGFRWRAEEASSRAG
jgi:hypothetical protein